MAIVSFTCALALQAASLILAQNQSCLRDYGRYLNQEQAELNQTLPKLHQAIVGLTGKYNNCLAKESKKPSGQPTPCGTSYQRLVDAQNRLQIHNQERDLIQVELALITRNPQQALRTLPCSARWKKAVRAKVFAMPCPCRWALWVNKTNRTHWNHFVL